MRSVSPCPAPALGVRLVEEEQGCLGPTWPVRISQTPHPAALSPPAVGLPGDAPACPPAPGCACADALPLPPSGPSLPAWRHEPAAGREAITVDSWQSHCHRPQDPLALTSLGGWGQTSPTPRRAHGEHSKARPFPCSGDTLRHLEPALAARSEMGSLAIPALALTSHLPPSFIHPRAGCPHLLLLGYLTPSRADPSIPRPLVTYCPQQPRGDGWQQHCCETGRCS